MRDAALRGEHGRPGAPLRAVDRCVQAARRRANAELYNLGITFTVYSDAKTIDRILPFDVIPRVLSAAEWQHLETGVIQRVTALNLLLDDIYHEQRVLKDGIVPPDLILGNANYRPRDARRRRAAQGLRQHLRHRHRARRERRASWCSRTMRAPRPGVSYVIENRHMMLRAFPDLLDGIGLRPVDDYGARLVAAIAGDRAGRAVAEPQIVLLSPGIYNSAYFEHVFLAREMGVPLVEGRDLVVEDDRVFMRTTGGLRAGRRDLSPDQRRFSRSRGVPPDSLLGVPGLMRAYRAGNVALANAVGTGVADDKAVYAYMPRIIRYYLGEEAILPNVETHICREPGGLRYTLDHLAELVVKPVGEAGGYGITVGPRASRAELDECRAKLLADPANYISQPCIDLSVVADPGRRRRRAAPRRSAAVRGHRAEHLGVAGRADPGGAARAARWSSTPRREAGRRTPGSLSDVLLARYAECIFWLARYVERAENLARILDVNETFSRDSRGGQNWRSIVQLNTDEEAFFATHRGQRREASIQFYVIDADNPTSIVSADRATRARTRAPCGR